jgi:hypothetical protein
MLLGAEQTRKEIAIQRIAQGDMRIKTPGLEARQQVAPIIPHLPVRPLQAADFTLQKVVLLEVVTRSTSRLQARAHTSKLTS